VAAADSASGQRVVELELERSATGLVLQAARSSLAELGCARPEELLAWTILLATSRPVQLEQPVELALPESRSGVAL
jgi:hypothetical protein